MPQFVPPRPQSQYDAYLHTTNTKAGVFRDVIIEEDYNPMTANDSAIRIPTGGGCRRAGAWGPSATAYAGLGAPQQPHLHVARPPGMSPLYRRYANKGSACLFSQRVTRNQQPGMLTRDASART